MLPKVVQGRNTGPSGRSRVRPSLYLNLPEHMLEDKVVHSASKIDHTTKHTSHLQKRKKIDVTDDNVGPIEKLRYLGVVDFYGGDDLEKAQAWLRDTDQIMKVINLTKEVKLRCVEFFMKGAGYKWWKSVVKAYPAYSFTWAYFKEEFEKTYCPEDHKKNGYKKLMKLVQGPTPIAEYVERFTELTQMVPDLTEKDKCERFKQGLKVAIKKGIVSFKYSSYDELVQSACTIEKYLRGERYARREAQKRREAKGALSKGQRRNKPNTGKGIERQTVGQEDQQYLSPVSVWRRP